MTVFWDVAPCSVVEIIRRFRGAYYLHHQVYFHFLKAFSWTYRVL
jgi:hypothetical protein